MSAKRLMVALVSSSKHFYCVIGTGKQHILVMSDYARSFCVCILGTPSLIETLAVLFAVVRNASATSTW